MQAWNDIGQLGVAAILALGLAVAGRADRVYVVDQGHAAAADTNEGTADAPLRTINAAAERVQAGETIVVRAGVYREGIQWRTPGRPDARITLTAATGETVVVKGSVVVTGWERTTARAIGLAADFPDANLWLKRDWEKANVMPADEPGGGHWRRYVFHDRPRQAFWKDAPLEGAGRLAPAFFRHELEEGRLYHDQTAQRLVIWLPPGVDPNASGIEVSLRPLLMLPQKVPGTGELSMQYVTIRGLQFRHAGTRSYVNWPAVNLSHSAGVVFEDNIVSWNDYVGFGIGGQDAVIRRNTFGYNGSGGMSGGGVNHLFEDNLAIANNQDNYCYFLNSGGGKLCRISDSVFRRHRALYNNGGGLWLDIECNDNIFEDCVFMFNTGAGLDIEISRRNLVRNSIFAFNQPRPTGYEIGHAGKDETQRVYSGGGGGWGLTNRQSEGTRIYHCLFYGNADGGLMILAGVRDPDNHYWTSRDCIVKNNIFADNGKWQLQFPHPEKVKEATGNVSDYNLFWGGKPIHSGEPLARWTRETGLEAHSIQERPDVPFGVDGNFELPSTSPAVDAGVFVEECPVDMRGVARPVGPAVDIGPFERASTLGSEHRPVIPDGLGFLPIAIGDAERVNWKDVPDTGSVPLSVWPKPGENIDLAPFAEALPQGPDGEPVAGTVTLGEVPFAIGYPDALLSVPPSRQGYFKIPLTNRVDWLFFLHVGSGVRKGWQAAYYRIGYADGDSMNISFTGEQNCGDYASGDPEGFFARERGTRSQIIWSGRRADGKPLHITMMAWPNHRPDVPVTGVLVWRQPYGSEWAILGLTAGNAPDRAFEVE